MSFDSLIHNLEIKIQQGGAEVFIALHRTPKPAAQGKPEPNPAKYELQNSGVLPPLTLTGFEHAAEGLRHVVFGMAKGAANEVVHHPIKFVGEVGFGAFIGAGAAIAATAAPEVAAVAGAAIATTAVVGAGVEIYQHGREWCHAAHVVVDPEHFSKAERMKGEATIASLGAGAANITALALGTAAGAPLAGVIAEAGIDIAESQGISNFLSNFPRSMGSNARRVERFGVSPKGGVGWPSSITDPEILPVASGNVRLYRGVKQQALNTEFNPTASEQQLKRWGDLLQKMIKGEKRMTPADFDFFQQAKANRIWQNARFYGDDINTAKYYAGPNGRIIYVDIPAREAMQYSKSAGAVPGPDGMTFPNIFALPDEWYLKAREHVNSPHSRTGMTS
jgi:cytochrome c5